MAGTRTVTIGDLAARTGVNIETIRYYERVGVLPATSRSAPVATASTMTMR